MPPVLGHDLLAVHAAALAGFGARLGRVGPGDWGRPTPCSEWDVRALVNHVVGANVRYQLILQGAPLEGVEATRAVDHLGDAPVAAFEATADATVRAFGAADLDRTFRHVSGERTGEQLLGMRIWDVGVHTWDLAVSVGGDPQIDAAVVEVGLATTTPTDDEGDDVTPQDRLLLRSGRQPTQGAD